MPTIRRAQLSGAWYPEREADILSLLDGWEPYFKEKTPPPAPRGGEAERVLAVVPHAGWIYSGKLAALVFRTAGKLFGGRPPELIVVLGGHLPEGFPAVAYGEDLWETPLSPLRLAPELNERLAGAKGVPPLRLWRGGTDDNTVEVELPLLKRYFPESPVLALRVSPDPGAAELGRALLSLAGEKRTLFAASTDLTHYGPPYGFAPAGKGRAGTEFREKNDRAFIQAVLAADVRGVLELAAEKRAACCGGAVAAVAAIARETGAEPALLDYYASSDVSGDDSVSVGYAGMIFCG
ncbi:MAG: AmmeMemoRadiSam system protein B [Deltaproteobacteria bacterium]|jgi:AmmeMemoRadiSam system protein B|nr:AmmeMemoRadiSam system protein B [Deltaproteobacteria bacterium]